jgi:hypothetical protein
MAGCSCGGACKKKSEQQLSNEDEMLNEYRQLKTFALTARLDPISKWVSDYAQWSG